MPDNRDLPHDELSFTVQQPAFLPWPGFFVRAFRADVVVLLDSVQFPRGFTWINRNRIKTPAGEHWLSVPVNRKGLGLQPVNRITLYPDSRWRKKLVMCLKHSYCHAPFFKKIYPFFQELDASCPVDEHPAEHVLAKVQVRHDPGEDARVVGIVTEGIAVVGQGERWVAVHDLDEHEERPFLLAEPLLDP
ncbi:MAG TPA: hypothetical protein EYP57_06890, partial [Thermodesulfobacteriaceae bacterium]|nr:hypothetical protein [Thermodesulfobacteriaceae bacterium]